MEGDHPWKLSPGEFSCEFSQSAKLRVCSLCPSGGWPSLGYWGTIQWMEVTIHCSFHLVLVLWVNSKGQTLSMQFTSFGVETILGLVGDHTRHSKWPSMAVITWYLFCELRVNPKFRVCSLLPSWGWPSIGWRVTILGMVGDYPWQLSPGLIFVS